MAIIFYWMIFKKIGQPGWYSLIPLFNVYVLFSAAWGAPYFWMYMLSMGCMIGAACAAMPIGIILGYGLGILLYLIMLIKIFQMIPSGKVWVVLTIIFDVVLNCVSFYGTMVNMYATGYFS